MDRGALDGDTAGNRRYPPASGSALFNRRTLWPPSSCSLMPSPRHPRQGYGATPAAVQVSLGARSGVLEKRPVRLLAGAGFAKRSGSVAPGADTQVAGGFCYVRIYCGIYQPALDCLNYTSGPPGRRCHPRRRQLAARPRLWRTARVHHKK